MTYAVPQCTTLSLQYEKANLEFDLTMLTTRLQRLSLESSDLSLQYQTKMTRIQTSTQDEDSEIDTSDLWAQLQLEYTSNLNRIQALEKAAEQQKIQIETQIKEIENMSDSFSKLVEQGVKESVPAQNQ